MCNRYVSPNEAAIERFWHIGRHNQPHWEREIFPRALGPFIRPDPASDRQERALVVGQWGLIGDVPVIDQSTKEILGFHDNAPDHNAWSSLPMAIFGDHTCKMQLLIEPFSLGPNVVPFVADKEMPNAYVFYAVNSLVQTQEYKRHWIPLTAKEVVVADRATAQRFASLIRPMLVTQESHRKAIRNLRRTRDLLLPRLLSGQIDVKAA